MNGVANKYGSIMKQGFDSAIIVDSKGNSHGYVLVRYTDSHYGRNAETQLNFHQSRDHYNLSKKCDSYNRSSVFDLLTEIGAKCFNHQGDQYHDRPQQTGRGISIHGVSQVSDLTSFKIGNRKYRMHWL